MVRNDRVLKGISRTTNAAESWHKTMKKKIWITHPNIGKFLDSIQKEEEIATFNISRAERGILENIKENYKKEFLLKTVVENYENFVDVGFLTPINDVYRWKIGK